MVAAAVAVAAVVVAVTAAIITATPRAPCSRAGPLGRPFRPNRSGPTTRCLSSRFQSPQSELHTGPDLVILMSNSQDKKCGPYWSTVIAYASLAPIIRVIKKIIF